MENMNIEKELFALATKYNLTYEQHQAMLGFTKEVVNATEANCSVYYYSVLCKLSNSINNAGHERRRSDDISLINTEMNKISDIFEDYLP